MVQSFFGMNITSYRNDSFWTNSTNYSEPTVTTTSFYPNYFTRLDGSYSMVSSPQTITNYPRVDILAETNERHAQSWKLQTFFITAVSLAIGSIIIPVISGTCIHWTTRFYHRNTGWIIAIIYLLWFL